MVSRISGWRSRIATAFGASMIRASEPIVEQRARFDLPATRICRPCCVGFFYTR